MLRVAFDAAGLPTERDVFTVAGLISSTDNWARLERDWESALADAGMPCAADGKPLPFHMTDFETRYGKFTETSGWTPQRKSELVGRLIGIIGRRVRARFSCSILMEEWYRLKPADTRMRQLPYGMCTAACSAAIAEWVHKYGNCEAVAYLFEGGTMGEGAMFDAFDDIARKGLAEKYYVGSRTKGDKRRPELQAADILAYEIRKSLINDMATDRLRPRKRKSFSQLMEVHEGGDFILTGDHILDWNRGSRRDPGPVPGRFSLTKQRLRRV